MPSAEHEAVIELIRLSPELVTDLLSSRFGVSLSEGLTTTPFSEAARVVRPRTFHADAAFVCAAAGGEPELAVVFEVQRSFDPGKRETWRLYLSHIENETRAPAALVVYCPDPRVGQRYREMAATDGISLVLRPFIVTPDDLPLRTDPQEAEQYPELTVFGLVAHMGESRIDEAFPAYAAAMGALRARLGADQTAAYHDLVKAVMSGTTSDEWSRYMSSALTEHRWLSKDNQIAHAKGIRKGKAEDLLLILSVRGVDVSDEARQRIAATTDLAQLDAWLRAAATADRLDEVLGDEG
ncbi:MAG: hypothetical protein QM621_09655 [Aeromicrobium sp.]|uniref:hypothetical protein n=1 Tax=Aeromicrobium sp. TaxID=1871063 RepID=UPI0039E556EE